MRNGAYFGLGYGPVWLKKVKCPGWEPNTKLTNCSNVQFRERKCSHNKDAGVSCGKYSLVISTLSIEL